LKPPKIKVNQKNGIYSAFGYQSAVTADGENRTPVGGSGSQHQDNYRTRIINQSRDFMRNNGIYSGMIERAVGYIVGNGFKLQALTGSPEIDNRLEKLWWRYWQKPEIKNIISGRKLERQVMSEILVAGDTGAILTSKGKVQHIEAEQIASVSPNTDGVEKDEYGAPRKFFVSQYGRYGQLETQKAKSYSPDVFCFIANPDRPSSTRGVPPCQSAFPMLHRINDVCNSEAIAWQMLARYAVAVTRHAGPEQGYLESMADDKKADGSLEGDTATRITELDYALIFHGEPGDEVKGIDRNIPGQNFSESLLMFLRLLGLPLGLPLEIILLDWTKSNYSQSRAVLEQAYQAFLGWQLLLEEGFLNRIFEWKVQEWVKAGEIPAGEYVENIIEQIEWIAPSFPWIDVLKETEAYGAKIDRGFSTHSEVCKSLNRDREEVVKARVAEIKDAIAKAQEIEQETGVAVDYRVLCGMAPEKSTVTVNTEQNKPKEDDNENR